MKWLDIARTEKGIKELAGDGSNPRIDEYLATVGLSDDATPWCSAFMNWVMARAGMEGTGSAAARSWLTWGNVIDAPEIGAVVILQRGAEAWQGHVGIVTGVHGSQLRILGGNQQNMVSEQFYPLSRVLGYRWPKEAQRHGTV